MSDQVQNLRVDIAVYRGDSRLEIFKGELPWEGGARKQAKAAISLSPAGVDNATIGISCSRGVLNTLSGFAVLSSDGEERFCCSFCCLPKSSQSLRIKLDDQIVEVMLTNNGERI